MWMVVQVENVRSKVLVELTAVNLELAVRAHPAFGEGAARVAGEG